MLFSKDSFLRLTSRVFRKFQQVGSASGGKFAWPEDETKPGPSICSRCSAAWAQLLPNNATAQQKRNCLLLALATCRRARECGVSSAANLRMRSRRQCQRHSWYWISVNVFGRDIYVVAGRFRPCRRWCRARDLLSRYGHSERRRLKGHSVHSAAPLMWCGGQQPPVSWFSPESCDLRI